MAGITPTLGPCCTASAPRHWALTINQRLLRRHWALAAHLPLPRTVTGPSPSTDSYYPVTSSMSPHWASRPRRHPATTTWILGPRCQNLHLLPRHWALTAIRLSLCQHWTLAAPLHAPSIPSSHHPPAPASWKLGLPPRAHSLDTRPLQPPGYCCLDTGPFPPRSRSLNTGPSPSTGSYCIMLLLPRSGSPDTWPSQKPCSYNLDIGPWLPCSSSLDTGAGSSLPPRSRHQDPGTGTSPPPGPQHCGTSTPSPVLRPALPQAFLKPRRSCAAFSNHLLRHSSSSRHPRAGSATLCGTRCPSPPSPPQVHRLSPSPHPTAGGVQLLSTMHSDSHHPQVTVALGPGLPRCAGPAAPRRLHRPPVATAPLITAVRRGASPAPRKGAASFNHVLRPP